MGVKDFEILLIDINIILFSACLKASIQMS